MRLTRQKSVSVEFGGVDLLHCVLDWRPIDPRDCFKRCWASGNEVLPNSMAPGSEMKDLFLGHTSILNRPQSDFGGLPTCCMRPSSAHWASTGRRVGHIPNLMGTPLDSRSVWAHIRVVLGISPWATKTRLPI